MSIGSSAEHILTATRNGASRGGTNQIEVGFTPWKWVASGFEVDHVHVFFSMFSMVYGQEVD